MGRRLSTWLVLARSFQVLGSFIPGAMNGWLLYYLHANRLGPSNLMFVLEILVWACHFPLAPAGVTASIRGPPPERMSEEALPSSESDIYTRSPRYLRTAYRVSWPYILVDDQEGQNG